MKLRLIAVLSLLLTLGACSSTSTVREADRQKSAEANAELGLRYMLQGKNDIALEKFKRALDQDPKSAVAHHYIAELYRRLGENDDADRHYRRAISLNPEESSAYNNYGVFLCNQKKYEQAEKQFQAVLKNPVYTGRAQTLENLGMCMREGGETAKAEDYFRKALQTDPRLPNSLLAMADISLKGGNALSSRAYLQRYSEVGAPTPESLWLGIRVERILGDKSAVSSYGLMLKNNFPEAEETRLYLNSEKR
jgi:type IV pilus assembly protein PilF